MEKHRLNSDIESNSNEQDEFLGGSMMDPVQNAHGMQLKEDDEDEPVQRRTMAPPPFQLQASEYDQKEKLPVSGGKETAGQNMTGLGWKSLSS